MPPSLPSPQPAHTTAAADPPQAAAVVARQFTVLAFVGVAIATSMTSYGPLIPVLQHDLRATAWQIGLLSTGLYVAIGGAYLPGGVLADRFGPRRVLVAALAMIGLVGWLLPLHAWLPWMIGCRLLIGWATGLAIIAGSQSARLGDHARLGQGLYGGATQGGAFLGLFATPWLAGWGLAGLTGWRAAFVDYGGLALIACAAGAMLLLPSAPGQVRVRRVREAARSRPLWALGLVHLGTLGVGQGVAPWLPLIVANTYQLPVATAARIAAGSLAIGMLVRPLGGVLLDRRAVSERTLLRAGTGLAAGGLGLLALATSRTGDLTAPMAAVGLLLMAVGVTAPYAGAFDLAGRIGTAQALGPGTGMGLVSTISAPASALGPPLIGVLLERSGSYALPCAVLTLVATAGFASAVLAGRMLERAANTALPASEAELAIAASPPSANRDFWRPRWLIGTPARRRLLALAAAAVLLPAVVLLTSSLYGSGGGNERTALAAGANGFDQGDEATARHQAWLRGREAAKDAAAQQAAAQRAASGQGAAPAVQQVPLPTGDAVIPTLALRAYREAESWATGFDPSCKLPWSVLAGIGRVESNHGRHLGEAARFSPQGDVTPTILGPVLSGAAGAAAIHDSDGGRWDGDSTWDRAVGPMQFLPSTWRSLGRDGNGDGVANPNNLFDAAAGAAGYLCLNSPGSLRNGADLRHALYAYNHSNDYVRAVITWANFYQQHAGLGTLATGPASSGVAVGGTGTAGAASSGVSPVAGGASSSTTPSPAVSPSGSTTSRTSGSATTRPSSPTTTAKPGTTATTPTTAPSTTQEPTTTSSGSTTTTTPAPTTTTEPSASAATTTTTAASTP